MTNAEKMFEAIFYNQETSNVDYIGYKNTITNEIVAFWKKKRTVSIGKSEINMKLLKAINEKVKELGWYD